MVCELKGVRLKNLLVFSQKIEDLTIFFQSLSEQRGKRQKQPFRAPTDPVCKDRACRGLFRQRGGEIIFCKQIWERTLVYRTILLERVYLCVFFIIVESSYIYTICGKIRIRCIECVWIFKEIRFESTLRGHENVQIPYILSI